MALYVQSNISSMNAQNSLSTTTNSLQTSMQRLSSGYRVNSAADDAAGLGIHMTLNASVQSLGQAQRNANDGISLVQTADGAAGQLGDILTRMRQLAVQSSNGTLASNDRANIGQEFTQLQSEMTRIVGAASFNGQNLLSKSNQNVKIQVGADTSSSVNMIGVGLSTLKVVVGNNAAAVITSYGAAGLKVDSATIQVSQVSNALKAVSNIDQALKAIGNARALFGASINRMNYAVSQIQTRQTNLSAADARIMDVDVASESANLSRYQVLQQAGTSMLAQANQAPQSALSLLR
jgi:flagellin